ncbi:hypothetical protein ABPG72_017423 [Tetrahymena utriculariae]
MQRIKCICLLLIFFIRCLKTQYDWSFNLVCDCISESSPNYDDNCAWITNGCGKYNSNNNANYCCVDQKNCYDVTSSDVEIGGFIAGRCLTNQNSFFLCYQFNLLQLNLSNWVITLYSGDLSVSSTNPVCQLQKIVTSLTCIGYRDLAVNSLNGLSGNSKICILGTTDNLMAVSCSDNYCINQQENNKCDLYDASSMNSLYVNYQIIGVSDTQRNCITQMNKVNSQNECSHLYVEQVCFSPADNTCWDLSKLNILDSSQPIGKFDTDGTCVFLGVYSNKLIKYCNQNISSVCLDSTVNNQYGCFQWDANQISQNSIQIIVIIKLFNFLFLKTSKIFPFVTMVQLIEILQLQKGIFSDGTCAYKDVYDSKAILYCNTQNTDVCIYNSSLNNHLQGCISWNLSSLTQKTQPIGIFSNYNCAIQNMYAQQKIINCNFNIDGICLDNTSQDNQACLNWNMSSLDSSISKQAVVKNFCIIQSYNFSYNKKQKITQHLNQKTFDKIQKGIFRDKSCAFLDIFQDQIILTCNQQINNICLDKTTQNNQACIKWQLPATSVINSQTQVIVQINFIGLLIDLFEILILLIKGIFNDYSCAFLNTYAQKAIQQWNSQVSDVCLDNRILGNQAVFWWKDSSDPNYPIGIFDDSSCSYLNIFVNKNIQNCNTQNNICIYNSNQNSNQQGCFQWDYFTQPSSLYPIGIYEDNSCAIQNKYSSLKIKDCNFNIYGICLDSTQSAQQACLNWNMNSLDPSISKQAVGIFEDKSCAFLNTQQNKNIQSCNTQISNICLDKTTQTRQACLTWQLASVTNSNNQVIGIFNDYSCAFLNTYAQKAILKWNSQVSDVCLDNRVLGNQAVFWWKDSSDPNYPIGIFDDDSCSYLNIFVNKNIQNCNTQNNICIYNSNQNSNQQGCFQWDYFTQPSSLYPIGIYEDNSCAIQNKYYSLKIKYCNFNIYGICLDNTQSAQQACLNWNMSSLDPSISKQAVGIFEDKSCVFLNTQQNKNIQSCNTQISNICLDKTTETRQACLTWQLASVTNSNSQVIGIFNDYSCAFLNTYAQKAILKWNSQVSDVCLDNRVLGNQAVFWWKDSSDPNYPIGIFDDDSCSYLNIFVNKNIKNCNTQNNVLSDVCLDNRVLGNQAVFWWKDSTDPNYPIGIFEDGSCAYLNTFAVNKIQDCNTQNNVCKFNSQINNNLQGCIQWNSSLSLQSIYPIGIYQDNSCAILNIYQNQPISQCNYNIQGVCLDNTLQNKQACLNWNMSSLDSSITKQAVGIYSNNSCAFVDQYQNQQIKYCNQQINNICMVNSQTNQGCLNWQRPISSVINSQTQVIGIFDNNSCAFLNSYASKSILNWISQLNSVCLDNRSLNNEAVFWWDINSLNPQDQTTPIGRYDDGSCSYLNIFAQKQIKFCNQQIQFICLNNFDASQQGCSEWDVSPQTIQQNKNLIGRYVDGACAFVGIYQNNQIQICNFSLNLICKDTSSNSQACVNYEIQFNEIVGADIYNTCLIENQPTAVKCSKFFCIDKNQSCKILSSDIALNRIMTQIGNYQCFGNVGDTDTSKNAIWCALGYCRKGRSNADGSFYCKQLGDTDSSCKDDGTHICIPQGGSSNQTIVDMALNYCFAQQNNLYMCVNTDTDLEYVIKDISGQCQKFTVQQKSDCKDTTKCFSNITAMYCGCSNPPDSSSQCSFGPLCLDSQQNCVHVDYSELNGFPGRKLGTSECQKDQVLQTVLCSKSFCLLYQQCFQMTQNLYISQENKTYQCLIAEQSGQYGAKWCINGFCKITNSLLNIDYCVKMQDQNTFGINKNQIVYQQKQIFPLFLALDINGRCLSQSQTHNNSDLLNMFCLDSSSPTPSCIPIDPLNTCVDSNNRCVSINSGKCVFCYITQCLSGNQCIPIQDSYCLGYNGRCIISTQTSICKACNQNECYNPIYYSCTPFINMSLKQDKCLIQVENYLPCQFKQLNDNQYCAAYDNQCKLLSAFPKCLRCPQTYLWVGTQTCYSSLMIEQIASQNQSKDNQIFTLSLIYKQLDTSPIKQQCSQGCQLCLSENNCLQCSFEYFLYQDSDLQIQQCILLPSRQIQYPDYLFEDKKFIEQNNNPQIAGIYKLYDYYFDQQSNIFQQKSQIPQLTVYYQVILNQLNQIVLQQLNSFCNIDNCASCQFINNKKICKTCQYKYALSYLNQCEPCPEKCLSCFYGGYYNQQSVNWSQILADRNPGNIDFSILSITQYRILCSLCSSQYVVTKDYTDCELCGDKCLQCYQGNIRFNLTSTFDIFLSQKQSPSIIKKCLQCSDGFIISPNMVDCMPISQNCLIEYFGKSDGSQQSFTSQYWWDTGLSYEAKCYACSSLVSINQGGSPYQCSNKDNNNYILNCLNTVKFSFERYCLSCVQRLSFNYNLQTCDVDCSKQMNLCVGCYSYTDDLHNKIFQCTQCLSKDRKIVLFPTFFGCEQCPEGCSSCYQSEMVNEAISQIELKNRTNQIIFEQIQPSLKERLNIQSQDNYEIICSSCQIGYFLKNKRCIKSQCGPSCDLCYMKNFNPICISCSYQNLQQQISNISVQIQSFYQLDYLNYKYMTHFNSLKQDCSLCPLGCLSCDQTSITNNPFSLYRATCYSCKSLNKLAQQIDMASLKSLAQNYEWRWDQDTNSCALCKINQQKCAYRKETAIYVKCLEIMDVLGSGTQQKPLNFQRASEAEWDKMIVNESEFSKALVYMNELGLRELIVDVHILDQKCVLQNPISITTSLLQLIPNLQVFQINIIGNYTQDQNNPQTSEINFQNLISLNGFLNVQFQNLNFSQTVNLKNSQNIIINNTDTYSFQLNNCSISGIFNQFYDIQPIQTNNSKLYQGFFSNEINSIQRFFFNIKIFNLRQAIQITNSSVSNLILYQSSLFSFINSQTSKQVYNISLQIENFNVSKVYFQQSSIIILSFQNIMFQANNLKLCNNLMIQRSILFQITPLGKLPIASLKIQNFNFQRNQLYQNSQLLIFTKLVYNLFKFITFNNNIVKNDNEFSGLIVVNQMVCLQLFVVNNILTKSHLFQNYDDGNLERQIYMKDQYYLFQFNQVLVKNNTIQLYQSSIFYYVGNSTQLNSLKLQGVVVNYQNFQDENLKSNLFSIKSCYKVAIININISHPNQINIFYIYQAQFYTSRGINIVNNRLEEQLKNVLFSINQIYRGIDIQAVYIQNITTTSPLIYIINDFVSYSGDKSIIRVNLLNANSNQIFIQQSTNMFSLLAIKTMSVQSISLINLNFQNNTALFGQNQIVNNQQSACSCLCIDAYQSYINIIYSKFINNYSSASRNVISVISNNANLTECYFSNVQQRNINTSITHGGLVFCKSSRLLLNNCFLQQGFAQKGGAVYFQGQQNSQIIIAQTQILRNRAALLEPSSLGGGVYVDTTSINGVDIILENSEISNNLATIQGGAFYISPFQGNIFFQISNSIMQNNFALQGAFFDLNFKGNGIGRVFIISSSFYNDPSAQLSDLLQIIDQIKSSNNQLRQFYLFDFTQVTQLYITGSTFESAQKTLNFKNENQKIYLFLYPALFRIQKNIQYHEYSNTYKNFVVSQNFINVNSKSLQIVQSQYYNIQHYNLTNIDSLIFYNSNFVVIESSSYSQLQCKFCQISAVQILAQQFQLLQSLFQINQGSFLGGFLLIQQQNQNQVKVNRQLLLADQYQNKIVNCIFQQNTAFNGGSLNIQFQQDFNTIVQGCQFIQNNAFNKGGVFYYFSLLLNSQINIIFIKNIFIKNSAQIGAIFYSNINQYMSPISNQNTVSSNSARYFGSLQISSPSQMQIMYKQTLYKNNSNILVQTSGYLQNELLIFTLDEQGQQYKELEGEQLYLKVKQVSQIQNAFVEETNVPFLNGSFNLTNYLKIYGKVDEKLSLQLEFDRVKTQLNDNYNLVINFQFDRDCQSGYYKTKILSIYDGCLPCKNNSFSLFQNSQVCYSCPKIDGFYCYLETYQLPNGYWRRESQSFNSIECYSSPSNCIGDTQGQQIQRYQLNLLKKDKMSQEVYFCAEGYVGALCEDCDILGQFWKQKYYKVYDYQCEACQVAKQNLNFTFNYIIAAVALNLTLMYTCIKTNIDFILNKISLKFKVNTEISDSYIILKLIINYIQIIGLIYQINTSFLGPNFQIIRFLSNPVYGFVFLYDCLISDFYQKYSQKNDFYVIFRIIFAQNLLVILYALTVLISTVLICFNKPWIIYFRGLINCFTIIIVLNICGILTLILESIFCIEIDGIYYLKRYKSVQCDTKFQDSVTTFLIPMIIFWALLVPLVMIHILKRKKVYLNQFQLRCKLGFLYHEYKSQYFYWEVLKIANKIVILTAICLIDNSGIQFGLSLASILSYKFIVHSVQPYQTIKFNEFEKIMINSIIICSILVFASLQQDKISNFCYVIFLLVNARLFLVIMKYQFKQIYLRILQKTYNKLQNQKKVSQILMKFFKNQMQAKQMWKKLANSIDILVKRQKIGIFQETQLSQADSLLKNTFQQLNQIYNFYKKLQLKQVSILKQGKSQIPSALVNKETVEK